MTARTRWLLIAVGGLLFAVVMLAVQRRGDPPAGSPAAPSNPAGRAAGAGTREVDGMDVKLELLQADRDSLTEADRNPFRFEAKAQPPPPRDVRQDDRNMPPVFTPPSAPVGPPPPPPIPLRYIGFVAARDGARTASFSDGRGNVFQGREGDIIEGRYKVLRVGTDSVELAYLDGRGRQTIRLSGQ